VIVLPFCF